MHIAMTALPMATVDDWAVTSDGRIAIVRGRDYHVDWLGADGGWTSTPRVAFAWERLDDERKTALIDSVQAAMQRRSWIRCRRGSQRPDAVAGAGRRGDQSGVASLARRPAAAR